MGGDCEQMNVGLKRKETSRTTPMFLFQMTGSLYKLGTKEGEAGLGGKG